MGNRKCGISQKRMIVEQNGREFGTRCTTVYICRVLLMPDSLSLVWGHSVHFAKFPMLRFSEGYISPSFHSISTKFYCKYVGHEGIQAVTVFGDLPKFYGTLKFWLTQNHMGLEISKRYSSYSFHPIIAKLYDEYGSHRGI